MLEFRVVGRVKFTNGIERVEYDNWGRADLSIETMLQLEHLYNVKYQDWYLEYREEGEK